MGKVKNVGKGKSKPVVRPAGPTQPGKKGKSSSGKR